MQGNTFNTADKVDRCVWLGGYLAAADARFIRANNIKRIVKMFADDKTYPGGFHRHPGVAYLVVPALDVPDYDIHGPVFGAAKFVFEGVSRGENVLVHCHAGISRSPTVVILYLLLCRGMNLQTALIRLKSIRPQVQPNNGFMDFLKRANAVIGRRRKGKEIKSVEEKENTKPSDMAPPFRRASREVEFAGGWTPSEQEARLPIHARQPAIRGGGVLSFYEKQIAGQKNVKERDRSGKDWTFNG